MEKRKEIQCRHCEADLTEYAGVTVQREIKARAWYCGNVSLDEFDEIKLDLDSYSDDWDWDNNSEPGPIVVYMCGECGHEEETLDKLVHLVEVDVAEEEARQIDMENGKYMHIPKSKLAQVEALLKERPVQHQLIEF